MVRGKYSSFDRPMQALRALSVLCGLTILICALGSLAALEEALSTDTLRGLVVKQSNRHLSNASFSCNDHDSCMKVHMENSELIRLLEGRCNVGESTRSDTEERRITFSHLPKTGGSSVRAFLEKFVKHRVREMDHEHFLLSALGEPNNLFTTMMREPISRAISFYCYVKDRNKLHKEARANKLWVKSFTSSPVQWAADPFIQRTMYQDPLGFFLRDIVNISDSITRYDYRKIQALPQVPLRTFTPGNLQEFLRYTDTMPAEYQCRQHLEVGFIFLKHYEVVGVLEDRESYFKVLFRRAHFPSTITLKNTDIHSNPTSFKVSKEDRAAMTEHLKDTLYCATVLYNIARSISEKDLACPL